jgi:hypothetical protein
VKPKQVSTKLLYKGYWKSMQPKIKDKMINEIKYAGNVAGADKG